MKHLFIINPKAGKRSGAGGLLDEIKSAMRGRDYSTHVTTCAGDATDAARAFVESGEDCRVYACGGDGTLSEVLNGIAGHPNAALTVMPYGTANDFARLFGNTDFGDVAALADGEERSLDLIETEGMYAIDICSVGFDARTARDVHRFSKLPLVTGFGAFTISAIYNLFKGLWSEFTLEADGERLDGKYSLICVANARHYGGGYMPMGDANPMDGVLDLLLIKKMSRLRVPTLLKKYKEGRYRELGDFAVRKAVREVKVGFVGRDGVVNMDGEMIHTATATIRLAPIKQRFFAPKGAFDALDRELEDKKRENERIHV